VHISVHTSSPTQTLYEYVGISGMYNVLFQISLKVISSIEITTTLLASAQEIVQKQRKRKKAAVERERYYKNKYAKVQYERRIQQQRDTREKDRLSSELKEKKAESEHRLEEWKSLTHKYKYVEEENKKIKKQKVEQEWVMNQEIKELQQKLDNNSVVERELRHVARVNKQLQAEVLDATVIAEKKAKNHRLDELILEHFHHSPTTPIVVK